MSKIIFKKTSIISCFLMGFAGFALMAHSFQTGTVRIPGVVTGFGSLANDDVIDGAGVIPSLRSEQLLRFNFDNLVAPNEKMTAGPETADVPGNFFFPRQRESYGFFPITIEKGEFGFYTSPGAREELAAVWFRAPFNALIDKVRAKVAPTELAKLISINGTGFLNENDWSQSSKITMPLSVLAAGQTSFAWARSATPTNGADYVLNFQRTPQGRWAVSDFLGTPGVSGKLKSMPSPMLGDVKSLYIRVTNGDDKNPKHIEGLFSAGQVGDRFTLNGVPAAIAGAKLEGNTRVVWQPITTPGWLVIAHERKSSTEARAETKSPEQIVWETALTFGGLFADQGTDVELSGWVDASKGSFDLQNTVASKDTLSIIFIGTDRAVEAPRANVASDQDPDLFTYAKELRVMRIQ